MATTGLQSWVGPGPAWAIPDKTPDTGPVMERDGTRITGLVASIVPGKPYAILDKTATSEAGTRRDDTRITQMGAWGGSFPVQATIADKEPSLSEEKLLSDTYLVYMSLGPLTDDVTLVTTDTYRPLLTLACPAGPVSVVARSDSYVPRLTLTVASITRSGSTSVYGADIYVPVLSLETASLLAGEFIEGSDTYTPVLTLDSGTGPEVADLVTASDTYTPVLQFGFVVTPSSSRTVPTSDTYRVRLTMTGTAFTVVTDVDRIVGELRPTGVITGRWI